MAEGARAAGAREVALRPIVLAAVLAARGQKGPAEIPGKREFTYRHVLWQACAAKASPLRFPPAHPFNPIAALRLCVAAGTTLAAVMRSSTGSGRAAKPVTVRRRSRRSRPRSASMRTAIGDDAIKQELRANTDAALAAGVFGVPTLSIDAQLFWGLDAHAFALAALHDPGVLADAEMQRLGNLPIGAARGG